MRTVTAPPPNSSSPATTASGFRDVQPVRASGAFQPLVASDTTRHDVPRAKISRAELANLTAQLAIMLQSGVDVASALQSLARQAKRPAQRDLLNRIYNDVLAGNSFSTALQPHVKVFGPSYVATVTAGEASGRMAEILNQLAKLQRSEVRLRNSVRTMLAYPLLLIGASGTVTAALTLGVLPRFAEIFAQFDTPLPAMTRILLGVSGELRGHYWFWGPFFGGIIAGLVFYLRSDAGARLWDAFILRAVVFRNVSRALFIGRICRLLGLMINSGVPLLDSLRIVRASIRNHLYIEMLDSIVDNVVNGRGLGNVLTESDFVPGSAAEMLITGERTGNLGMVTEMLGEHFQEEGERKLRDIVTILEPVITIGMGLVVAVVVLSVMLPVFDMASFARG